MCCVYYIAMNVKKYFSSQIKANCYTAYYSLYADLLTQMLYDDEYRN